MCFSFIGLCQLVYKMTGQWKLKHPANKLFLIPLRIRSTATHTASSKQDPSAVNHFFSTCSPSHTNSELKSTSTTLKILTSRMLRSQRSLSTAYNHDVSTLVTAVLLLINSLSVSGQCNYETVQSFIVKGSPCSPSAYMTWRGSWQWQRLCLSDHQALSVAP